MSYKSKLKQTNLILSQRHDHGLTFTLRKAIDLACAMGKDFSFISSMDTNTTRTIAFNSLGINSNPCYDKQFLPEISHILKHAKWSTNAPLEISNSFDPDLYSNLESVISENLGDINNKIVVVDLGLNSQIPNIVYKHALETLANKHNATLFVHIPVGSSQTFIEIQHLRHFTIVKKDITEDVFQERVVSL